VAIGEQFRDFPLISADIRFLFVSRRLPRRIVNHAMSKSGGYGRLPDGS
jgi:hypothetical protein